MSFTFAGFSFPRPVADMAIGFQALKAKRELRKMCGGYTHAPRPNNNCGIGFYLDSAGMPGLRYELTGDSFYCDEDYGQTIEGLIFRLPHGRGFLSGWTMGEHMASNVSFDVWDNEDDARRAARDEARQAAQDQIEYEQAERERMAMEDEGDAE